MMLHEHAPTPLLPPLHLLLASHVRIAKKHREQQGLVIIILFFNYTGMCHYLIKPNYSRWHSVLPK